MELDDERRSPPQRVGLPGRGAAGIAGQTRHTHPHLTGEPTFEHRVADRLVDDVERLMEPDRDRGAEPKDETSCELGLPLRQSVRPGIVQRAAGTKRTPAEREVPVQIDAAAVHARVRSHSVGIEVFDNPHVHIGRRTCLLERTCDCNSCRLVPMDTSDDQHFPSLVWVAELDYANEPSLGGTPERFMTCDRAIRDSVRRRSEGNEADRDAAQARHAAEHDVELRCVGRERVDSLCNRVRGGEHRQVSGAGDPVERRV